MEDVQSRPDVPDEELRVTAPCDLMNRFAQVRGWADASAVMAPTGVERSALARMPELRGDAGRDHPVVGASLAAAVDPSPLALKIPIDACMVAIRGPRGGAVTRIDLAAAGFPATGRGDRW